MTVGIPDAFLDLLRARANGRLAMMSDGAPQLTPVWVDVGDTPDGHVALVNSRRGRLKNRNVALEISDPADSFRYLSLHARVVAVVEEGARAPLEALSQR
jgi:hypothetical protein